MKLSSLAATGSRLRFFGPSPSLAESPELNFCVKMNQKWLKIPPQIKALITKARYHDNSSKVNSSTVNSSTVNSSTSQIVYSPFSSTAINSSTTQILLNTVCFQAIGRGVRGACPLVRVLRMYLWIPWLGH